MSQETIPVRITECTGFTLFGLSTQTSLVTDNTKEVWNKFMVLLKANKIIPQRLFSVQTYPEEYYIHFEPTREFTKWACAECLVAATVPAEASILDIPAGAYAVFTHYGGPTTATITFNYIFSQWLPNSGYRVDHRPHFEILGQGYSNNDPESVEEIWIPIAHG